MEVMLIHSESDPLRIAYPAVYEPRAMPNDPNSKPAYGGKLIVKPGGANHKKIVEAMRQVAREHPKYGASWESILEDLIKKERVCFIEGPYKDKDGKPRDGFEGNYYLSMRNEKLKPTAKNKYNQDVAEGHPGAPYPGCHVHAAVDIWAQDNSYGRRINCSLQGVMFAADGPAFGGGRPADDNTFAAVAVEPSHADLV